MSFSKKISDDLEYKKRDIRSAILNQDDVTQLERINTYSLSVTSIIQVPSLDLSQRQVEFISEPIGRDYPVPTGVGISVGTPYNGIKLTIPVIGNAASINEFFPHLSSGQYFIVVNSNSLVIKKFAINETIADVKTGIREFTDQLINELIQLAEEMKKYRTNLETQIIAWINERKSQIITKSRMDKDADPWG